MPKPDLYSSANYQTGLGAESLIDLAQISMGAGPSARSIDGQLAGWSKGYAGLSQLPLGPVSWSEVLMTVVSPVRMAAGQQNPPSVSLDKLSAQQIQAIRFALKEELSTVAMHLSSEWRKGLFSQIDQLLDTDDFEEGTLTPKTDSWRTLIRLIIFTRPKVRPGLAMLNGLLVVNWLHNGIRVTVECFGKDEVHYVASRPQEEGLEVSAGETTVRRLAQFLAPYDVAEWLFDGGK